MGKRKWKVVNESKKKLKRQAEDSETEQVEEKPNLVRRSDDPVVKKVKWINKQRVLIFASRGINFRGRHLMLNFREFMPHSRPDTKKEKREGVLAVNEICEMKNCNKCIYFETKKRKDLYMWVGNVPNGPSAKFLVENVHTMEEMKLTGNCLKGSRPVLSFDKSFEQHPHYALLKELLTQVFGTPRYHPKSQPFIDHVLSFTVLDNRIWFRNYQIMEEDTASLVEIGPRFVLNPIKIFSGSFGGTTLWDNPYYRTPNQYRRELKLQSSHKFLEKVQTKAYLDSRQGQDSYRMDPTDQVFNTVAPDEAKGLAKKLVKSSAL
jgi:ribosome biogenesis protein BRX1